MEIYVSVSDKDRHLTLDGDLDLLDRLLATINADRGERAQQEPTPVIDGSVNGLGVSNDR